MAGNGVFRPGPFDSPVSGHRRARSGGAMMCFQDGRANRDSPLPWPVTSWCEAAVPLCGMAGCPLPLAGGWLARPTGDVARAEHDSPTDAPADEEGLSPSSSSIRRSMTFQSDASHSINDTRRLAVCQSCPLLNSCGQPMPTGGSLLMEAMDSGDQAARRQPTGGGTRQCIPWPVAHSPPTDRARQQRPSRRETSPAGPAIPCADACGA